MCLLKHKETNQHSIVANTHLYANPTRDYAKLAQTFCLLQHISKFQEKLEKQRMNDVPVILCGDLNSRPKDSSIHLIMNKPFSIERYTGRLDPHQGFLTYNSEN